MRPRIAPIATPVTTAMTNPATVSNSVIQTCTVQVSACDTSDIRLAHASSGAGITNSEMPETTVYSFHSATITISSKGVLIQGKSRNSLSLSI